MKVDSNLFNNVPEHQTNMLKQFIEKHPRGSGF